MSLYYFYRIDQVNYHLNFRMKLYFQELIANSSSIAVHLKTIQLTLLSSLIHFHAKIQLMQT